MSAMTVVSRGILSRNLALDDDGIVRGRTLVTWDDVDHYRYDWQDWSRPGDLVVVSKRADVIRVAPIFDQWYEVAERVLGALHPRLRAAPYHAPFELAADALVHATAGRLPFAELARVEIAALGRSMHVVVHARGGGEWIECDISQIACSLLWLDELAGRGVVITSPLSLHAPPILGELADRIAAAEQLPEARVVRP